MTVGDAQSGQQRLHGAAEGLRPLLKRAAAYARSRWGKPSSDRLRPRHRESTLGDVRCQLDQFSSVAERIFLPVGERLNVLQRQSREIANQTASLGELLSQDDRSLLALDGSLNTPESGNSRDRIPLAVRAIQQKAAAIQTAIGNVVQLVHTFDVLGMMTHIESSRFEAEGAVFAGLAEAVTALSRQVREKIGATAGSAADLLQTARQAADEAQLVAHTLRESLGPLIRQTTEGLSLIRDRRGRSRRPIHCWLLASKGYRRRLATS